MSTSSPDWNLLAAFLAVMRTGSLSAAARDLQLAQPTVRRKIESLEAALGAPLFTRAQNWLTPNEAAKQLMPQAIAVETAFHVFQRSAISRVSANEGVVRLTASLVFSTEILPPLLAELHQREPGITIELHATDDVEDVLRREADIAIRLTEPKQDALLMRKVRNIEIGLFANASCFGAGQPLPLNPHDIVDYPFVWSDKSRDIDQAFALAGLPQPKVFSIRTDNTNVQLAAIKAGLGIGVCQTLLGEAAGLLRVLPDVSAFLPCYIVMHEDLRHFPPAQTVFGFLVDALKNRKAAVQHR
jgi:DNA-binding transcriptional LysR family regulator